VVCTALDQCHVPGTCDTGTGLCSNPNKPNGSSCDDGNPCTDTDACVSGSCAGGPPTVCTSLDQCHDPGVCDSQTGCSNPNKADGSPCNDGNSCTEDDTCTSGTCGGLSPTCGDGTLDSACGEQCDDGNTTDGDGCSSTCQIEPACPAQPSLTCRATVAPKAGSVTLKRTVLGKGSNKLTWKWKGEITPKVDFGDPSTNTEYHFCVYDETAGTPTLVLSLTVPAGGTCTGFPCWKTLSKGYLYKDKALSAQGVAQVKLKEGLIPGKAQIQVKGKGITFPSPNLPFAQDPVVIMQVNNTAGVCWSTTFTAPATKNVTTQFGDRTD
jgi:cysteine-rich repeat protein